MLPPADAELVLRDTRLPGLATLLDPERMIEHLRHLLGHSPGNFRSSYLSYRPGKRCRAGFEIDDANGVRFVHATAFSLRAFATSTDRMSPDAPPPDSGRLVLADEALVIDVFPNDDRLPVLAELYDQRSRRKVLANLLPDHPELWNSDSIPLRYRPGRRYVAKLQGPDGEIVVVKLHTPRNYTRARDAGMAFGAEGVPRVPRQLGCDDGRHALAVEWLPGDDLKTLLAQSDPDISIVMQVGETLADLHTRAAGALPAWNGNEQGENLHRVASWLDFVLPDQAQRAEALAHTLATALESLPTGIQPLHGDFSPSQVIVADGEMCLIDLDDAVRGDPAIDLGGFVSRIERHALRGSIPVDALDPIRDAFFAGYRAAAGQLPDAIPLHVAAGLLRFAPHPFRPRRVMARARRGSSLAVREGLDGSTPMVERKDSSGRPTST